MSKRYIQFLLVFIALSLTSGLQKANAQGQVSIQSFLYVTGGFGGFNPATSLGQDHFASGLTVVGDLNGDGVPDLAVGASSTSGVGCVYIFFMNANGTVKAYVKNAAPAGAKNFGVSVAGIKDIDGDGIPDIAVGSSADPDGTGLANSGDVFICFMKANGTFKSTATIAGTSMNNWSTQTGSGPQFGCSVASAGDIDNDGVKDIIVGASADKNGTSTGPQGSAFIVFLTSAGGIKNSQKLSPGVGNFPSLLGASDQFGSSVAGIGDVNGDGVPDVAVGAPNTTSINASSGAYYVVYLAASGKAITNGVGTISNSTTGMGGILPKNENFGNGLTYLPDFGYPAFHVYAVGAGGSGTTLASSTGDNDFRTGSGAVFIVFLNKTDDTVLFTQKISGINPVIKKANNHFVALDHFGLSILDYGTSNNNTIQSLFIGAPYDSGFLNSTGQGSFYEINFKKPDVKVDTILYPADTVCGNSAPKVGVVFQNLTPGPIDSIPFQVNVSGAITATLQDTFYGTANQGVKDTLFFKQPFPTNKSGTNTVKAFPLYPGDFNPFDDTAKRTVYVLPLFTKPNFGPDTTYICPYTPLTLDLLNAGSVYSWFKDGSPILGAIAEKYSVPYKLGPGKYLGTATIGQCSISDSIQVIYVKNAVVNLGPAQVVCAGVNDTLSAGYPDAKHNWYLTSSPFLSLDTSEQYIISNNKNASYFAVVTYSLKKTTCRDTGSINITFNNVIPNLGPDTVLCQGQTYVLNAQNPGSTYSWYKNGIKQLDTAQTDTVSVTGKYYATIQRGSCGGTDTANITFLPMPVVSLAPDFDTLCGGITRLLNAGNPAFKHLWYQDGQLMNLADTTTQYTVTTDGAYKVLVENRTRAKCQASDVATVTYNILTVNLNYGNVGPTFPGCQGTNYPLTATYSSTINDKPYYQWYKNGVAAGNNATITIDTDGQYKVIVTVGNCTATDSTVAKYTQISTPKFGNNDTLICRGTSIVLDAGNPGATYVWTTPKGKLYTEQIVADTDFNYKITVNKGSCSKDTNIQVKLININVQLGKDTSLCTGSFLTLDAGNNINGATYQWYLNGIAIQGATEEQFNPEQSGTYEAQVFQKQCTDSGKINVTFIPSPNLVQFDTTVCYSDSVVLDAGNPGYKITWNKPPYPTTQKITVRRTISPYPYDLYEANITNGLCSGTSIFKIYFYSPVLITSLPASVYLCDSFSNGVTLNAGAGFTSYNWEPTGDSTSSIFVTDPGKYTVKVANSGGCPFTDSVQVYACPPSDVYIPNAFTPNGDDVNDSFKVYNLNSVYYQLSVYNRWGERVFFSNDPNKAWDGTYESTPAPEGVYNWTLVYRLNTSEGIPPQKIISGNVMLLRP